MRDFTHRKNEDIVLSTGNRSDSSFLTEDSRNLAMFDLNCRFFVAGQLWVDCFLQILSSSDTERVKPSVGQNLSL